MYEQREAQVREFIYGTIDSLTFMQIKGNSAAEVWRKLVAIHATKDHSMFAASDLLLNELQTIRYIDGDDMRAHLGSMKAIRERLAETGTQITDDTFNMHIRTSLSLITRFRTLFITLDTVACVTKTKISSSDLIWYITEEDRKRFSDSDHVRKD